MFLAEWMRCFIIKRTGRFSMRFRRLPQRSTSLRYEDQACLHRLPLHPYRPSQMKRRDLLITLMAMPVGSRPLAARDANAWEVSLARNKSGDTKKIVRYRSAIPGWVTQSRFPSLVVISWPTASVNGMPAKDESTLHYAFEDTLLSAEEREKTGWLAGVATGEGKVEWLYYAKSHDEFMTVLNRALHGQPRLPIAISLEQDPGWTMYGMLTGRR